MTARAEPSTEVDTVTPMKTAVDRIARGEDHVDILDGGEPVAVLVSVDAFRRFKRMDAANRQALHEAFTEISRAFADVPDDELERELEKARVEYRAERKAERDTAADR